MRTLAADLRKLARSQPFDLDWVETYRRDFLILMKNIPKVNSYKTAIQLADAFRVYRKNFHTVVFDKFLNYEMKARDRVKSEAEHIDRKLRKVGWDFYIQLSFPINHANKEVPEDAQFARYKSQVEEWERKTKRTAAAFWKATKEVILYSKEKFVVDVPVQENQELEGFRVQLRGYNPDDDHHSKELDGVRAALRIYRQQAAKRMPLLLKKQCPIVLDFDMDMDLGGEYRSEHGGIILVNPLTAANKQPAATAKTISHEVGHHIYRTVLSGKDKEFWNAAIEQNYGDLDIEELLKVWQPESLYVFELHEALAHTHPIIALQVQAWIWGDEGRNRSMEKQRKDYYYDLWFNKNVTTIRVPKIPITGYANKNPEESFCEAVGLLVAYGPRAVHEVVLGWLQTILPGQVRTANLQQIASELEILSFG